MADGTITGFDQAEPIPESQLKPNFAEGFARGFGNASSPQVGGQLQDFFAKHHQQRLAEAQMHSQGIATSGSAIKQIKSGINPETGEAFVEGKGESKEDMLARYMAAQNLHRQGLEKLVKATGDKEAHGKLQSVWHMLDHVIHGGGGQQQPQPSAAAASTAPQTPAAQTPPPTPVVSPQGTATSSGGFPITGARPTPPPAETPPKAQGRGPAAAPSTGGQADHTAEDTMRTLPGVRQRMAVDEAIDTTQRAEKAGIKTRREIADQIPDLKKNSPEYWDFVLFNKPPSAASTKPPSNAIAAWIKAREDANDPPTPDEIIQTAQKLKAAGLNPVNQAKQDVLDAIHKGGDVEAAKKALAAISEKKGPENPNTWTATLNNPNSTPEEKAIAKKNIDTIRDMQSAVRAAGYVAGARERAKFVQGYGIDAATGEGAPMSMYEAYQERLKGRSITFIGRPSFDTATSLEKFTKEAPAALEQLETPLKDIKPAEPEFQGIDKTPLEAFDDPKDQKILARILQGSGVRPVSEEAERTWIGNVLDQYLKSKDTLSPEGRALVSTLSRMKDTVFTVQTSLGAQKTDAATELFMAMLPGAGTPDSAFARTQLHQFRENAKRSVVPAMKGIVQMPPEWREPGVDYSAPVPPSSRKKPTPLPAPPSDSGETRHRTITIQP